MPATCSFDALPLPVIDCFIFRGEYSNIGTSNVYIHKRFSIENRDFIRGNAKGDFKRNGKTIRKNRIYHQMRRYGNKVNGSPLKKGSRELRSSKGKRFIKFWKRIENENN